MELRCKILGKYKNIFVIHKPDKSDKEALKAYNLLIKPKPHRYIHKIDGLDYGEPSK